MTVRKEKHDLANTVPLIDAFAPIYQARADAPPILLLTGDRRLEMLGRCEENELFCRILRNLGHPDAEHLEFEGYGHGMSHPANPVALRWIRKTLGCSPEALIVPLDRSWSFAKGDTGYAWQAKWTDPNGEPKPSVELLGTGGRDGGGCLAVRDGSTTGNAYAESAALPVLPGKGCIFTGWVRNEDEGEGVAGACLNLAHDQQVGKQVKTSAFPVTAEWSHFELTFAPIPAGADGLILYILPRAPGQPKTATGAVLFDDLLVRELPATPGLGE
jgi:hypothetical protein